MQRTISSLLFLITAVLVVHNTVAQEIKVVSGVDGLPLPFATVTNHSHPLIVSCNQDGMAHITASTGDTLSISYVGYKTAILVLNEDKVQVVRLLPDQKTLPPVTIHNCRKTKEFNYNNFKDIKKPKNDEERRNEFGGIIWTKGTNNNAKIAVRLNPLKANGTLKDFSFWIEKESDAPASSILTPLLISVYEVADSTYMPGELILNAPIFYFPKKSGKQTIKLDTLYVRIPASGIYISFQYIMNDAYEWSHFSWHTDSAGTKIIDSVIYRYGGIIRGLRSKDFDLVWYNGIKDKWLSLGGKTIPNDSFHSTIKCEATIKFCEDE